MVITRITVMAASLTIAATGALVMATVTVMVMAIMVTMSWPMTRISRS